MACLKTDMEKKKETTLTALWCISRHEAVKLMLDRVRRVTGNGAAKPVQANTIYGVYYPVLIAATGAPALPKCGGYYPLLSVNGAPVPLIVPPFLPPNGRIVVPHLQYLDWQQHQMAGQHYPSASLPHQYAAALPVTRSNNNVSASISSSGSGGAARTSPAPESKFVFVNIQGMGGHYVKKRPTFWLET